jgi:MFS superfamily sulfate permease-like transporter
MAFMFFDINTNMEVLTITLIVVLSLLGGIVAGALIANNNVKKVSKLVSDTEVLVEELRHDVAKEFEKLKPASTSTRGRKKSV